MAKRSIVFLLTASAAEGVEVEISHVEARRLIRDYGLPNSEEDEASLHDIGRWSKRDGRYFVHMHT